jgi:formylmethanofuran dehydrogenase subunit E
LIRPGTLVKVCAVAGCIVALGGANAHAQQTTSTAPNASTKTSTRAAIAPSGVTPAKRPFVGPPTPNVSADNVTALAEISFVHSGTEPFAVAGYRIGQRALKEFKLTRGSILIEVEHHAPEDVQWASIADGVQVATGVSAGRLNLHIMKSPVGDVSTVIRDRRTGRTLVFRLAPQFTAHFAGLSHDRLDAAGTQVIEMPDDQIFVMAASQ